MECRPYNDSKVPGGNRNDQCDMFVNQADGFQETFPNFMSLTDEERYEFFQTLHAAKMNLEKSGVTVKPQFGTVHDKSWNYSNASDVKDERKTCDAVSVSSKDENLSANPKSNYLGDGCSPVQSNQFSTETLILQKGKKRPKKDNVWPGLFPPKNSEITSDMSKSFQNSCSGEDEVGKKSVTEALGQCKKNFDNSLAHSSSYRILNEYVDEKNNSMWHRQDKDALKVDGMNLKVQVTLTSADNERMKSSSKAEEDQSDFSACLATEKSLDKKQINCREDTRSEFKQTEQCPEINDPDIEDLLKVEKEIESDEDEDLSGGKKESRMERFRKKLYRKKKSKRKGRSSEEENNVEDKEKDLEPKDPDWVKPEERKLRTDSVEEKREVKNKIRKKNKEKAIKGQGDSRGTRNENDTLETAGAKKFTGATKQRVLRVSTLQGKESDICLGSQQTDVQNKKQILGNTGKPSKVKKPEKQLHKKKCQNTRPKESGLKAQKKKNEAEFKGECLNGEKVISEDETILMSSKSMEKEEIETPSDFCSFAEAEGILKKGKASNRNPKESGHLTSTKRSTATKEFPNLTDETFEETNAFIPPFKPGKVVFVDDNVIEKIKKVILDLEKESKPKFSETENEYLVLLVEHVEYLSTVMETLFEDRVLKKTTVNPCVKFDDENLAEIQQCLQMSTSTEDGFDSEGDAMETMKKRKKRRPKTSFLMTLGKCFKCGKKKVPTKGTKP